VTPHQRKIAALVPKLLKWFSENARDLPWRRRSDPYSVLVSEIMLQQTQVTTVIPFWERWMRMLPDLRVLAQADQQTLHKLWEGLGYYTRVRNLQKAAQVIMSLHRGRFPENFKDILALPGIGRYTAGAICSIAFNQPHPVLDGNVIRVLTRLFGVDGNPRSKPTNEKLWTIAGELVQGTAESAIGGRGRNCAELNQSLMELGALICTARQPACNRCPVKGECVARRKGSVSKLPNLPVRVRSTPRRFVAFVARCRGRYLVRQRPRGVVNAYLWEFPNVELTAGDGDRSPAAVARALLGIAPITLRRLCVIKHSITRYRIRLQVFEVETRSTGNMRNGCHRWLAVEQLSQLPFPSAHKRIVARLV
jgi:A/G-specific adenine glycosylase